MLRVCYIVFKWKTKHTQKKPTSWNIVLFNSYTCETSMSVKIFKLLMIQFDTTNDKPMIQFDTTNDKPRELYFFSFAIDMMPTCPVLSMDNGWTNGKVHVYWDKQIPVVVDIIVSFVIQSGQVLEGRAISVLCHINCSHIESL